MSSPNSRSPNERTPDPNAKNPNAPGRPPQRRRRGRRRPRSDAGDNNQRGGQAAKNARREPDKVAADDPARALSDSLQATVLRHTAAGVLSRGKGYAKRNRVSELRVDAGRVRARVLGSGDARYRVEVAVPQRPVPPVVTKLRWSCDCPYAAEHRRGTCKHVVAVALVAARRFERTESLRRRWLGQPASNAATAAPAEFDALADRLLEAFTAEPVSVDAVLSRAVALAPPPFDVPADALTR